MTDLSAANIAQFGIPFLTYVPTACHLKSSQNNAMMLCFREPVSCPFHLTNFFMPHIIVCNRKSKMIILEFGIMLIVLFVFLQKPGYCYCNK